MAKKKLENLSFEESLSELDTIVQSLEQGDLSLENSMALFERGLNLSQLSQVKLQAAEQKVQILLEKNGNAQLTDFDCSTGEKLMTILISYTHYQTRINDFLAKKLESLRPLMIPSYLKPCVMVYLSVANACVLICHI